MRRLPEIVPVIPTDAVSPNTPVSLPSHRLRVRAGVTQQALADKLDQHQSFVPWTRIRSGCFGAFWGLAVVPIFHLYRGCD